MGSTPGQTRSRRAVIAAAAAASLALVAEAAVRPVATRAGTGTFQYGAYNDAGNSLTNLESSFPDATLQVINYGSGPAVTAEGDNGTAFIAHSLAAGYASLYGYHNTGYGVIGDTGTSALTDGMAGVWGRDISSSGAVGAAGASVNGTGVVGIGDTKAAVDQPPVALGSKGLPEVTGVYGVSVAGVGVRAQSTTGTALKVTGKTHFSRSGRATVGAGHSYVDVAVSGGVTATSLCFANLTAYRAGVSVAAVRPAYPTASKIRIYLTKTVTSATVVAWLVSD